jgi:hypothetical protein
MIITRAIQGKDRAMAYASAMQLQPARCLQFFIAIPAILLLLSERNPPPLLFPLYAGSYKIQPTLPKILWLPLL